MAEEIIRPPHLGRAKDLTLEDLASIKKEIGKDYADIRSGAGENIVDHKRLRGIRNSNLAPDVRYAKAIVSPTGQATGGDFTDIQQAIDYVNDLGAGTVFIKDATYPITAKLVM